MAEKSFFLEGPIPPSLTGEVIGKHSHKTEIGGHALFLGQVRADKQDGQTVQSIEYTAYQSMANTELDKIKEEVINNYSLTCVHLYHSLGEVKAGEISLFVMVSAPHRQEAFEGQKALVEAIKTRVPIWGKESFSNGGHQWKTNEELINQSEHAGHHS